VEGGLLLDVVVGEGATILKLFSSEDEALLVGRDTLFVLDLGLDIIDGVRELDFEGNGLPRQSLDEDLHSTAETEDEVEGRLCLDVTRDVSETGSTTRVREGDSPIAQGATIFELHASEDETLLVRGNALLVLDFGLDVVDGVRGLDLEGDGLSGESLNEDLHAGLRRGWSER
jgi:hypothetical protein